MQTNEFRDISYQLDESGIVTVKMNTPKRKNAMSGLTALELREAARHFQDDDNALAMILTGAEDPDNEPSRQAFSSGGYFVPGIYDDVPPETMAQIDQKPGGPAKGVVACAREADHVVAQVGVR